MLNTIIVYSDDPDSNEAAKDLIESIDNKVIPKIPTAGILYISCWMEPQPIVDSIMQRFPDLQLIGCSTEGNVGSEFSYNQDNVVLILFSPDKVKIKAAVCQDLSNDTQKSVNKALESVLESEDKPAFCFTLPESLTIGGDPVVTALRHNLESDLPIFGGLSADKWNFDSTFQIYKNKVYHDAAPLLLFMKNDALRFSYGVSSGWVPVTDFGEVTKVEGNHIHTINNQPAGDFYKNISDDYTIGGEFPLLVESGNTSFLRAPLIFNEASKSISFAGNIPLGAKVRIASASRNKILGAVESAINNAADTFDGKPDIALITSCAARHYILTIDVEKEIKKSIELLGDDVPIAGFYSYGELSPDKQGGTSCMHNQTFTILLLGEVN
jgi:hypothetical protein